MVKVHVHVHVHISVAFKLAIRRRRHVVVNESGRYSNVLMANITLTGLAISTFFGRTPRTFTHR